MKEFKNKFSNRKNKNMSPKQTQRQECTVYSRVVGWITPTNNWNKGKQAEYVDRKEYKMTEESC